MVLINEKKFACATCIKGHRVSGCTHTERPLFEIKKKGRPSTQCQCCKDRRKGNSVHTKCICGDTETPQVILPESSSGASRTSGSTTPAESDHVETRKGQPGSSATFPNGLRDVHEIAAAAEALHGLAEDPMRSAERSVARLLNPCSCKHTGICKCCEPKRASRKSEQTQHSGYITPDGTEQTEHLVELFRARVPAHPVSGGSSPLGSSPISPSSHPASSSKHSFSHHLPVPDMSPSNPHHPAHTSRHVHKTKLYSPYSHTAHSRHTKRDSTSRQASSQTVPGRPVTPALRPLADMPTFLGAIFQPDGSLSSEISRSALGLPGIQTFDAVAGQAEVKSEPMDWEESTGAESQSISGGTQEDVDMPLAFPTSEDVTIGACTCGENCRCPGCTTHPNPADNGENGGGCTDPGCKSCFDCTGQLHIPAGMTSIEHLLATAAANVPKPARMRHELKGTDTAIRPPSAMVSPDAAASLGLVQLRPLECCNGRCQCRPGECVCAKDCCGCCIQCACGEDAPTPTASTYAGPSAASGGCCSSSDTAAAVGKSCCETGVKLHTPRLSLSTGQDSLAPPGMPPNGINLTPPRLSPGSASGFTFNPSPYHSPLLSPNHPPSLSVGGSSHHSPQSSPHSPAGLLTVNNISRQPSPGLATQGSAFDFDSFQLPSPSASPHPDAISNGFLGTSLNPAPVASGSLTPFEGNAESAPPLRRASSTISSSGHAHSQSTSSLSSRRATVTSGTAGHGASIQRSASTGKQASKALALNQPPNHPHIRPIAPKPGAGAGHLAPPKSGQSRAGPSTNRRKSITSSHHSRATSPAPPDHSRTSSSSSASHIRQGVRGSVDHDIAQILAQDQPLPIVTTSAPDETSQQVSFDPLLDDPALKALLDQFDADGGFNQQKGDGGLFTGDFSFDRQQQQQAALPDFNISGHSGQISQDEMYQLLASSIAGQNGSSGVVGSGTNGQSSGSHIPTVNGFLPVQPNGHPGYTMPNPLSTGSQQVSSSFPGYFPDMPTYTPAYPPAQSQWTQQSAIPEQTMQVPQQQGSARTRPSDLIDLSKPLNAEHLQRIIKALQEQQDRETGTGQNQSQPTGRLPDAGLQPLPSAIIPPSLPISANMPPPPIPSSSSRRTSDAQQPLFPESSPFDFDSLISSTAPTSNSNKHQPSFSFDSFDSFLAAPALSDSSGSASNHGPHSGDTSLFFDMPGISAEEDVFDKYIVENPLGEGLDLSVLDLGQAGEGAEKAQGLTMGLEGLGVGTDDWIWKNGA